jgi:hypothetical protein
MKANDPFFRAACLALVADVSTRLKALTGEDCALAIVFQPVSEASDVNDKTPPMTLTNAPTPGITANFLNAAASKCREYQRERNRRAQEDAAAMAAFLDQMMRAVAEATGLPEDVLSGKRHGGIVLDFMDMEPEAAPPHIRKLLGGPLS